MSSDAPTSPFDFAPQPARGERFPGACFTTPTENLPAEIDVTSAERTALREAILLDLHNFADVVGWSIDGTYNENSFASNRDRRQHDNEVLAQATWCTELLTVIGLFDAARRPITITRPRVIAAIAVTVSNWHERARTERRVLADAWSSLATKTGMAVVPTGLLPYERTCSTAAPASETP